MVNGSSQEWTAWEIKKWRSVNISFIYFNKKLSTVGRACAAWVCGDVPVGFLGWLLAVPAVVGGNPGTQAKPHFHTAGELPHLSVGFTTSLTFLLQQFVPKRKPIIAGGRWRLPRGASWGCSSSLLGLRAGWRWPISVPLLLSSSSPLSGPLQADMQLIDDWYSWQVDITV